MYHPKAIMAAAAVAVCPAVFAAQQVDASTVSGQVVVNFTGTIQGTPADANGDNGGSAIAGLRLFGGVNDAFGGFDTINALVNPTIASPLGWGLTAVLSYGMPQSQELGSGFDQFTEVDPANLAWRGPAPTLNSKYNNQSAQLSSLFGVGTFMNLAIGQALGSGTASGDRIVGGVPLGWTLADVQNVTPPGGPLEFSGGFDFVITGEDNSADFLDLFRGFAGIASEPDLFEGTSFTASITIAPIPVPAALPLLAGGLGLLGLMGWRRRRETA